mmetsp:Transcript_5986/g.14994  ORF Transcript_5986/g.14994 Transcript_5986/m.14994 type:complete len:85 (-) Transcript_5986:108-362(-)
MPTNDPPYSAKTDVGSEMNNDPNKPITELARTGSAAAESSLHSRKKIVATDPIIWNSTIVKAISEGPPLDHSPRRIFLPTLPTF